MNRILSNVAQTSGLPYRRAALGCRGTSLRAAIISIAHTLAAARRLQACDTVDRRSALHRGAVLLGAFIVIGSSATAHAHPGHDLFSHGVTHAATSPYHLLALALLGILVGFGARFIRNARLQTCARVAAGACVLIAAMLLVTGR